jgi:hypothetical protein
MPKTEIIKQPVGGRLFALSLSKQKTADQVTDTAVLHFTISFLFLFTINLEKSATDTRLAAGTQQSGKPDPAGNAKNNYLLIKPAKCLTVRTNWLT